MEKVLAEEFGREIAWLLSKMGGKPSPVQDWAQGKTNFSRSSGAYVIYLMTDNSKKKCVPIYCGCTGKSIDGRMGEHRQEPRGVHLRLANGELKNEAGFSMKGKYLIWYIECDGMIAKLVESALLHQFDFPLNFVENGTCRAMSVGSLLWRECGVEVPSVDELCGETVARFVDNFIKSVGCLSVYASNLNDALGWFPSSSPASALARASADGSASSWDFPGGGGRRKPGSGNRQTRRYGGWRA